jgi:hypothetical protein
MFFCSVYSIVQTYKQDSNFSTEYQNLVVNDHALFVQQLNIIQHQT